MLSNKDREFIGWFWGEGTMTIKRVISRNSKDKKRYYQPTVSVTQRDDNPDIINWCKKRFGGSIYRRDAAYESLTKRGYKANPRLIWQLSGFKGCWKVIEVLRQGELPDKKKEEIKIFERFLNTSIGSGRNSSQKLLDKQEAIKMELQHYREYSLSS